NVNADCLRHETYQLRSGLFAKLAHAPNATGGPSDMDTIVFSNLSIIDGSGAKPFAGEVRVQGNRIAAVARDGATLPREDARPIDAGGATLMPGLVEA